MDIITDLCIMFLPIAIIIRSNLPGPQKIGLVILFALGLSVIAISVIRISKVNKYRKQPPLIRLLFWSTVETGVAIITCCITTFKSLLNQRKKRPSRHVYYLTFWFSNTRNLNSGRVQQIIDIESRQTSLSKYSKGEAERGARTAGGYLVDRKHVSAASLALDRNTTKWYDEDSIQETLSDGSLDLSSRQAKLQYYQNPRHLEDNSLSPQLPSKARTAMRPTATLRNLHPAMPGCLLLRAPTLHDRIKQLESLVVDLMQKTSDTQIPATSSLAAERSTASALSAGIASNASPASDSGSMRLTTSGASYVNSSHWAAILDEIAEIKDHFEREKEVQASPPPSDLSFPGWTSPQLLYGCANLITKEEILASIPPRPVVDRLVSRYFNCFEMSPAVLHSFQFLKEYEIFWEDPSAAPVIWLGLLFTIMCLATLFQKFRLDPNVQTPESISIEQDFQRKMEGFRQNIVHCLILGNYTKGGPYVLETLILYFTVELFTHPDAEIGVWILLGTIVQLAIIWATIEIQNTFRKECPPLQVKCENGSGQPLSNLTLADTKEPSNLQDSDFDESTVNMPPSRPETDLTPMLYRLVKCRMMSTVGYIWDFAADTRSYTYNEVMKMDKRLHDAHESIPECLKWHSMVHSILDSPQIIMQKVFLDIIFHRARIVLHRKYLYCSPTKSQYSQSQQACLNAALELLKYQHILQEETQPFCRLYQERWRVSSLVNHDFLLATSILCFYLQKTRGETHEGAEVLQVDDMWATLRRSYDIWLHSSGSSKEAQKAAKALRVVLSTSCNASSTGLDVEINTPLEQANPAGFDIQSPAFDATMLASWASPTNEHLGGFAAPTSTSNVDRQAVGEPTHIMNSLQWPWDVDYSNDP
ncbi:fungal specific transcription factor domain-containing protein [Arthroderma uncinatum]|uniref:fungal specific transcription factor domain-containing protein n=1 Tax=Arthroderma uncinatum TaxID=74035 RepID=UPI00144ABA69|nr:fungal specific transcription factor domain-containing protein [Arthroderma uncinatum]KAF3480259.1 fungal specific transcription factor domain-containing protein [Arthroderma uncinatum]